MKYFAKPTRAPEVRISGMEYVSLGLAVIFTILALAQLFTFEEFSDQLGVRLSASSVLLGALVPSLIVVSEVFFVPFLLRMYISPAFRGLSMGCGWLASGLWLGLAIFSSANSGGQGLLLGDVIPTPGGPMGIFIASLLAVIVAIVSLGMWPRRSKGVKARKA